MLRAKKFMLVCGTRPNFMKIAPLMRAIEKHNQRGDCSVSITPILVHTGQHYDYSMSKVFFDDLQLGEPDIFLNINASSHAKVTGLTMIRMEEILLEQRPDIVIVVGDVNSIFAATVAAVKLHIPVAHVEAGARTYDKRMPEEVNRVMIDSVSTVLFPPTQEAEACLLREGIARDRVFFVGNTMTDCLLQNRERADASRILESIGVTKEGYVVVTVHRADNVDNPGQLDRLIGALRRVSELIPVVFPAHPRTLGKMRERGLIETLDPERFKIIEPLGYLDFIKLVSSSKAVLTDSGSIQGESTVLGIPCRMMYHASDWTVTITHGTNRLIGTDPEAIVSSVEEILRSGRPTYRVPPLWDGKASERIIKILAESEISFDSIKRPLSETTIIELSGDLGAVAEGEQPVNPASLATALEEAVQKH